MHENGTIISWNLGLIYVFWWKIAALKYYINTFYMCTCSHFVMYISMFYNGLFFQCCPVKWFSIRETPLHAPFICDIISICWSENSAKRHVSSIFNREMALLVVYAPGESWRKSGQNYEKRQFWRRYCTNTTRPGFNYWIQYWLVPLSKRGKPLNFGGSRPFFA